ncbi:MAG TPA: hypothetical protein VK860_00890, partial [Ilumatobacteraceae bacterium]|nr:hypothetical protein [Ilumatobacteraceae bacterium]
MRVPRRLIAFAAVAALVGAACGSDDDEATTDTGDTDTTEQTETTDAPDTTEAPVTTEATTETTEYQPP